MGLGTAGWSFLSVVSSVLLALSELGRLCTQMSGCVYRGEMFVEFFRFLEGVFRLWHGAGIGSCFLA